MVTEHNESHGLVACRNSRLLKLVSRPVSLLLEDHRSKRRSEKHNQTVLLPIQLSYEDLAF